MANNTGANALGVIMTGLGDDSAVGLLEMRKSQRSYRELGRENRVAYGMPIESVKSDGAEKTVLLQAIASESLRQLAGR